MKTFISSDTYDILEDILRVENTTYQLSKTMESLLRVFLNLDIKRDWERTDIPTVEQMERIRHNVETIRKVLTESYEIPPFQNKFNYENANELEIALDYTYKYLRTLIGVVSQPIANLYYANEPLILPSGRE